MKDNLTKKEKVRRRKKKIADLMHIHTQSEIAATLGVRRITVARDIQSMKRDALDWADDLPRGGYILNIKQIIDKLFLYRYNLEGELVKTDDVTQKISLTREIRELLKLQVEILNGSPTIYALRKAFDHVNVQAS